jgi:hypothetical protein
MFVNTIYNVLLSLHQGILFLLLCSPIAPVYSLCAYLCCDLPSLYGYYIRAVNKQTNKHIGGRT